MPSIPSHPLHSSYQHKYPRVILMHSDDIDWLYDLMLRWWWWWWVLMRTELWEQWRSWTWGRSTCFGWTRTRWRRRRRARRPRSRCPNGWNRRRWRPASSEASSSSSSPSSWPSAPSSASTNATRGIKENRKKVTPSSTPSSSSSTHATSFFTHYLEPNRGSAAACVGMSGRWMTVSFSCCSVQHGGLHLARHQRQSTGTRRRINTRRRSRRRRNRGRSRSRRRISSSHAFEKVRAICQRCRQHRIIRHLLRHWPRMCFNDGCPAASSNVANNQIAGCRIFHCLQTRHNEPTVAFQWNIPRHNCCL